MYAPSKTFEEIVKKPDIKGAFLLLILVGSISLGTLFVSGSKVLIVPPPESDNWTDHQALLLWSSNGNTTLDETDFLEGNASIKANVPEGSEIWLNSTAIGSFDFTTGDPEALSFSIKWATPEDRKPDMATLTLFSTNDSRFELDILNLLPSSNNQWGYALTIDSGPDNPNFLERPTDGGSPDWVNITGISFLLSWEFSENRTLKIDGLHFGKYMAFGSTEFFQGWISQLSIIVVFDFLLKWFLFAAGLWLVVGFAKKKSTFKELFYTTGYCFSGLIVYVLARLLVFLVIPPFKTIDVISSYVLLVAMLAFNVWPMILGTFALKNMHELSGKRALYLSVSAYFVYFFVAMLLVFGISLQRVLFALP